MVGGVAASFLTLTGLLDAVRFGEFGSVYKTQETIGYHFLDDTSLYKTKNYEKSNS